MWRVFKVLAVMSLAALSVVDVVCGDDAIVQTSGQPSASSLAGSREPAESPEELVAKLASRNFEVRRGAFLKLWELGTQARPAWQAALSSDNRQLAELAGNLELLLELQIEPGASGAAAALVELLNDLTPQKIVDICRLEYWDLAAQLIENSAQLKDALSDNYGRFDLNRIVEEAYEQGNPELAWPIVRTTSTPEQATWIAAKLKLELPSLEEAGADARAVQLFYSGDTEAAIEEVSSPLRRVVMLTRSYQWGAFADEKNQRALLGFQPGPAQAAARACLVELSGDPQAAEAMWDEILLPVAATDATAQLDPQTAAAVDILHQLNSPTAGNTLQLNQFMLALLISGRVEPIERYLAETDSSLAYSFYAARNDFARAFEQVGLGAELETFDRWLDAQREKIVNTLNVGSRQELDLTVRIASALVGLGYRDQAQQILEMLAETVQRNRKHEATVWADSIVRWLGRHESRSLCLQVAREHFDSLAPDSQAKVLSGLFPELGGVSLPLYESAPVGDARLDGSGSAWHLLERLQLWDRDYFGDDVEQIVSAWLRLAKQQVVDKQPSSDPLSKLAAVARGFGYDHLALELLSTDLQEYRGKQALNLHWLDAAEIYLDQRKPQQALELLAGIRQYGYNVQAAYVSEVAALLLAGEYTQAERLDRSRWLRSLATERFYGASYADVTRHFSDRGDTARALEYAEPAFLFADPSSRFAYWAASDYADLLEESGNYQMSADVQRAPLVEALQPFSPLLQFLIGNGYISSLRYSVQQERLARAIAAVKQGEFESARRQLDISRKLQPQDIEAVVQCYPSLTQAGQSQLAEELFEQYEQAMLQQIRRWPNDATALNNLAWMYAKCDRNLEQALELAQRAVGLAPSSPVFLDTLAEVEFRNGLVERALESMRGCVKLDPRDQHYRENLVRYRAGR